MSNMSPNLEDTSPVFCTSPYTLQDLASMQVALRIWLKKYQNHGPIGKTSTLNQNTPLLDTSHLRSCLQTITVVPPRIKELIEVHFDPITNQMGSWFDSFRNVLYNCSWFDSTYCRYDLVIFGGDGTVNIQETVANFCESDLLSSIAKFELACVFCIEEKIDDLWSLVENLQLPYRIDTYSDCFFMRCYWTCRKKGQLDQIDWKRYRSIEHFMIEKCCRQRIYPAAEYFLKSLDPVDRLSELDRLCESENGFKCVLYLLPHFEGSIQRYLICNYGTRFFTDFVKNYEPIERIVRMWLFLRDFITDERFHQDIILCTINSMNSLTRSDPAFKYQHLEKLFFEIWSNAPDHLKKYILDNHISHILREILLLMWKYASYERNGFLSMVLSEADDRSRNNFWINHWSTWINILPPSQFEELMKQCLVETDAIRRFKVSLKTHYAAKFRKFCDKLIITGGYDEFDKFLNDFDTSPELVLEVKKNILMERRNDTFFNQGREESIKYAEYIDTLFSNDVLAADFKNGLIFCPAMLLFLAKKIDAEDFRRVEFIVSVFVSSNRQAEARREILKRVRARITYSGMVLCTKKGPIPREFFEWCSDNDEQRISDFNDIFQASIEHYIRRRVYTAEFKSAIRAINDFLSTYFGEKSVCESFLREKIQNYEAMDEAKVKRIFNHDKITVIEVLRTSFMT